MMNPISPQEYWDLYELIYGSILTWARSTHWCTDLGFRVSGPYREAPSTGWLKLSLFWKRRGPGCCRWGFLHANLNQHCPYARKHSDYWLIQMVLSCHNKGGFILKRTRKEILPQEKWLSLWPSQEAEAYYWSIISILLPQMLEGFVTFGRWKLRQLLFFTSIIWENLLLHWNIAFGSNMSHTIYYVYNFIGST